MTTINAKEFSEMDKLSEKGEPFIFIIDFLKQNILLFTEEELNKNRDILVHFQKYRNYTPKTELNKKIYLQSFPETFESYKKGFDIVMKNLQLGNSYLINYTRKTKIETNLTLQDIFYHSEAKYKICYKNNWVFFSPEVFVKIENQKISTFPMKGTIDADIPDAENILKNDPKEKAEHYTVVDLLRNDLSIVADDVKLVDFQRIDYLQTLKKNLYTMSSEIEGTVKPSFQNKIGTIMQKLLPAGSILGAPKDKTQEVILKSESYDRGFYTGICGYFDGKDLDSGVMIRFIENENNQFYFKSGGGITHQSDASAEYQEMINKIYVPVY
ncbi:aminodeoxychorismate synthase component I [Elizabethkingia anophelis]|uniref:Para-aminobenzoate synthase, aminase component n=1 Tax=Elizabethkingia anophelis NUHP1 TaxID=1338011 RepID=A0A077EB11_9FLAO|nr:aminodeoxychorismate synthase component I [Elizabethkingia anophelis]AIL43813.1 Para-aminobenzoate synthase, aminase component [Elizabethkingia anophelis NUHP1]MBE9392824.1 aminodeoxychorismate synthase component I [Elizabethkingia anophelis]MBE9407887.1 aminodeoxychorismate synthase component I [Elizabethkingia anophelis]MCT4330664.1 aminodeoxychorismate synthase component I [Elizabethkingia anophelis]MDV3508031.1 aminodeoxychorismate synthase component I [Elizabethkingia anophelis]